MSETSPQGNPIAQPEIPNAGNTGKGGVSGSQVPASPRIPVWLKVVPFFLSAFFFLSALFAVFAPLPLLFLRFRSGRRWAWGAAITNAAIVGLAAGRFSLALYAVFVAVLALVMSELLLRRRSVERTAAYTLLAVIASGALVVAWHSHIHHVNPIQEFRNQVSMMVDYIQSAQLSGSGGKTMDPVEAEEWKRSVLVEFPSAIAVFALILVWANLATLLRVNPDGVREKLGLSATFLRDWKAPEWMVWPTIISGFFLIVDAGAVSTLSLNVFRFLMAIYAIQGLSILSFFFDVWNVRGFFRTLGFLVAIFLMMPLLLSLGFFDLWFDFRAKFRQV